MSSYRATVDGLIQVLTKIKQEYGGHTPIQVNAIGTPCVTRFTSICVDDDLSEEPIVYIETDIEDRTYSETFGAYTQSNREI